MLNIETKTSVPRHEEEYVQHEHHQTSVLEMLCKLKASIKLRTSSAVSHKLFHQNECQHGTSIIHKRASCMHESGSSPTQHVCQSAVTIFIPMRLVYPLLCTKIWPCVYYTMPRFHHLKFCFPLLRHNIDIPSLPALLSLERPSPSRPGAKKIVKVTSAPTTLTGRRPTWRPARRIKIRKTACGRWWRSSTR